MMITSPHKRSRSNRKRAKTYDLAKAPLSPGQESSSIPLIDFNGFYTKNIQESVENMDLDSLCDIDETKYSTIYEQMIESFRSLENNNTNVLDYDHDQNLIKMQNMILNIIPKEVSSKIYGLWPPIIPTDNENVQNLIFLIIKIIQASPNQMKALQWFSRSLLPLDCPDSHSHSNSLVKGICLCHRKRKMLREKRFFWAEIMNDNTFTLYLVSE